MTNYCNKTARSVYLSVIFSILEVCFVFRPATIVFPTLYIIHVICFSSISTFLALSNEAVVLFIDTIDQA